MRSRDFESLLNSVAQKLSYRHLLDLLPIFGRHAAIWGSVLWLLLLSLYLYCAGSTMSGKAVAKVRCRTYQWPDGTSLRLFIPCEERVYPKIVAIRTSSSDARSDVCLALSSPFAALALSSATFCPAIGCRVPE